MMCVYIYIYRERERKRYIEIDRERERERDIVSFVPHPAPTLTGPRAQPVSTIPVSESSRRGPQNPRATVCVIMSIYIYIYTHTYIHTYMCSLCIHTCIYRCIYVCIAYMLVCFNPRATAYLHLETPSRDSKPRSLNPSFQIETSETGCSTCRVREQILSSENEIASFTFLETL